MDNKDAGTLLLLPYSGFDLKSAVIGIMFGCR